MPRCEDYPCCGHGPAPLGDGGGCPDENGCYKCVGCGRKLPRNASSSLCSKCQNAEADVIDMERQGYFQEGRYENEHY